MTDHKIPWLLANSPWLFHDHFHSAGFHVCVGTLSICTKQISLHSVPHTGKLPVHSSHHPQRPLVPRSQPLIGAPGGKLYWSGYILPLTTPNQPRHTKQTHQLCPECIDRGACAPDVISHGWMVWKFSFSYVVHVFTVVLVVKNIFRKIHSAYL